MLDLIFFAAIAAFIIYRLFTTLGKESDGSETKKFTKVRDFIPAFPVENAQVQDANFEVISKAEACLPDNIRQVFEIVRAGDKTFNAKTFVDGAKKAFEMIIAAFYRNDIETLKELLDTVVYRKFIRDINDRIAAKLEYEVTLVGVKNIEIVDANIQNNIISIKVRIESEQIKLVKDSDGNVVDGSVNQIHQLADVWTFGKDIAAKNSWQLIETSSK